MREATATPHPLFPFICIHSLLCFMPGSMMESPATLQSKLLIMLKMRRLTPKFQKAKTMTDFRYFYVCPYVLCPTLSNHVDCSLPGSRPWGSPGNKRRVDCHFLLQGIFPIQGSNPCLLCLLYWQVTEYDLGHLGSPMFLCI